MKAAHENEEAERPAFTEYDYSNFYYGAGDDPLNLLKPFQSWYRRPSRTGTTSTPSRSAARPRPTFSVRDGKTGEVATSQHGFLQLPGDLVSRGGEAGRASRRWTYGLGASGIADPVGHLRHARGAGGRRRRLQGQGSGHPLPDRLQRERRVHLRADARRRHTSFSTSTRTPRSWTGRSSPSPRRSSSATTTPWTSSGSSRACKGKKLVVVEGVYSMDGDMCALPEIVEVTQAPRRADPDRRGALHVPLRPERPRRGRALRPRQGGRLPPRHLLQEPRGPGRVRLRRRGTCGLLERIRALALLLLQPRAGPRRRPARRRSASWRTSRSSGRGSGATSPTCAGGSPRRASTSASPTPRSCRSWSTTTPRSSRWRRRSSSAGSSCSP